MTEKYQVLYYDKEQPHLDWQTFDSIEAAKEHAISLHNSLHQIWMNSISCGYQIVTVLPDTFTLHSERTLDGFTSIHHVIRIVDHVLITKESTTRIVK